MVHIIEENEFPCGLKTKFKFDGWGIIGSYENNLEKTICPLHGKNCKRTMK